MAFIQCDFYSETLGLSTSMNVILPQQTKTQIGMDGKVLAGKYPVLYLLHGYTDDHTIWGRRTSIERYVADLGIAVVMPQIHNSYYTDMSAGGKYWTFLTEELPRLAQSFFPLSDKQEDNFVAGLSMGGYGALKWALSYPERFAAVASLSGVTDIVALIESNQGPKDKFDLIFGKESVKDTPNDLLWLLKQADQVTGPKPVIYQACGTEDFLYEDNVKFKEVCKSTSYNLTTDFGPGDHEWGYWDDKIQHVLEWLPLRGK